MTFLEPYSFDTIATALWLVYEDMREDSTSGRGYRARRTRRREQISGGFWGWGGDKEAAQEALKKAAEDAANSQGWSGGLKDKLKGKLKDITSWAFKKAGTAVETAAETVEPAAREALKETVKTTARTVYKAPAASFLALAAADPAGAASLVKEVVKGGLSAASIAFTVISWIYSKLSPSARRERRKEEFGKMIEQQDIALYAKRITEAAQQLLHSPDTVENRLRMQRVNSYVALLLKAAEHPSSKESLETFSKFRNDLQMADKETRTLKEIALVQALSINSESAAREYVPDFSYRAYKWNNGADMLSELQVLQYKDVQEKAKSMRSMVDVVTTPVSELMREQAPAVSREKLGQTVQELDNLMLQDNPNEEKIGEKYKEVKRYLSSPEDIMKVIQVIENDYGHTEQGRSMLQDLEKEIPDDILQHPHKKVIVEPLQDQFHPVKDSPTVITMVPESEYWDPRLAELQEITKGVKERERETDNPVGIQLPPLLTEGKDGGDPGESKISKRLDEFMSDRQKPSIEEAPTQPQPPGDAKDDEPLYYGKLLPEEFQYAMSRPLPQSFYTRWGLRDKDDDSWNYWDKGRLNAYIDEEQKYRDFLKYALEQRRRAEGETFEECIKRVEAELWRAEEEQRRADEEMLEETMDRMRDLARRSGKVVIDEGEEGDDETDDETKDVRRQMRELRVPRYKRRRLE